MAKKSHSIRKNIFSLAFILMLATMFVSNEAWGRRIRDTLHFKKAIAEREQLVLIDSTLNAIGIDSLLDKIEYIHNTLNNTINANTTGYDTKDIAASLKDLDSNIGIIDDNISKYAVVLDVKNLQMFQILLSDLQTDINNWQETLIGYNQDLTGMNTDVNTFIKDTVLKSLMDDSAFRSLYFNEVTDLELKMDVAKKMVAGHLAEVNRLLANLSNHYFETIDLNNQIVAMLKKTSVKSMGKEYDYLWQMHDLSEKVERSMRNQIAQSYSGQYRILKYYFKRSRNDQLWMLALGILFTLWIFRNFRILEKSHEHLKHVRSFLIIRKSALLPSLVVIFNLSPFFDVHSPTAYVDIMQCLMVFALTLLIWRIWSRKLFIYWVVIAILFVVISVLGAVITPDPNFRLTLFVLNITSIVFGILWYRVVNHNTMMFSTMMKIVAVIYIALNFISAIANLMGRLSLSKIMSVTAIHGLTQIIGLSVFIHIITEAFQLQTMVNKVKGGLTAKMNFEKIQNTLSVMLHLIAICIWSIVFSISLNLFNLLFNDTKEFLEKERKIGGTSFELGSIALFCVIIFISHMVQKGIGSLYGNDESWDPEVKKNGSRLAMTRLVLIVLGFLIAVAASGLPIDKITIVLGALGVGIGLGLQSIVNNLVSGVVLIFEQPFRIGDFIGVGEHKGRVLDIGIRSSKLMMEEGSEMILPNADLLSGKVINWTMRDEHIRIEIPLTVETELTLEELKLIIKDSIKQHDRVINNMECEILLEGIKDNQYNIIIYTWVNSVHKQQTIKSELLYQLSQVLKEKNIKIV